MDTLKTGIIIAFIIFLLPLSAAQGNWPDRPDGMRGQDFRNMSMGNFTIPPEARAHMGFGERFRAMENITWEGAPALLLKTTRRAKLLWLFDVDMEVERIINAVTGEIEQESRPWWSFLAAEINPRAGMEMEERNGFQQGPGSAFG